MSTVTRIPVHRRLHIASLQLLIRVIKTRWFRLLILRPPLLVYVYYRIIALALGAKLNVPATADAKTVELVSQIEAARNTRMETDLLSDTDRMLLRALTWGVAGIAVIIVTTIITAQKFSPALWVACACFVLAIPFLAVLGFMASYHVDPKKTPPTVQETINLHAAIYAADLIFGLGFAALLWSYNPSISILFVASCWLAWRYFKSFAAKTVKQSPSASIGK
jgi:ABC-type bacteriocin/lantibiotic exporter with double-glycine peptidase domain